MNEKAVVLIRHKLLPGLKLGLSQALMTEADVRIDENDTQIINFYYPKTYQTGALLQFIRLEIGPLATLTPAQKTENKPYVSKIMSEAFEQYSAEILTVSSERTFWEKATILHREANRLQNKPIPMRYSTHYHDLYMMGKSEYEEKVPNEFAFLEQAMKFKPNFTGITGLNRERH